MQYDTYHAIYTLLEGSKWVILGRTAKPNLQMSRRIKKNKSGLRMRRQEIYWFQDKTLALRVHADVCAMMKLADMKRAGDNRSPKFVVSVALMDQLIRQCAVKANIAIVSDADKRWSKARADNKLMRKLETNGY